MQAHETACKLIKLIELLSEQKKTSPTNDEVDKQCQVPLVLGVQFIPDV